MRAAQTGRRASRGHARGLPGVERCGSKFLEHRSFEEVTLVGRVRSLYAAAKGVGSKNSNLLNDPDFTTEMLADQRAARPV